MSTREKLIKARLGMLALAEELQNISLVCRKAGISRSHFYEIKEAYEKWGAEGLPSAAAQTADRHRLAGNQRLLRTLPPHGEGRVLRRGLPQNALRITRTVAARPR